MVRVSLSESGDGADSQDRVDRPEYGQSAKCGNDPKQNLAVLHSFAKAATFHVIPLVQRYASFPRRAPIAGGWPHPRCR